MPAELRGGLRLADFKPSPLSILLVACHSHCSYFGSMIEIQQWIHNNHTNYRVYKQINILILILRSESIPFTKFRIQQHPQKQPVVFNRFNIGYSVLYFEANSPIA